MKFAIFQTPCLDKGLSLTLRLIYYTNNQLYGRGRNNLDLGIINNYINTLLAQTPTLQNSGQITNGPGTLW